MRQHSSTASARTERVPLAVDVEIERYGVRVEPDPESGRAGLTQETIWPVRNILERDENFLALVGKRLTGPEAEGNSGPAPILDSDRHFREGLGAEFRLNTRFVHIRRQFSAADSAGPVARSTT